MSRKQQQDLANGARASRSPASRDGRSIEERTQKAAFLVRQFGNPQGRLLDRHGRSTKLALSAKAWGEPVPKNSAAARKLAKKGAALLARLRHKP